MEIRRARRNLGLGERGEVGNADTFDDDVFFRHTLATVELFLINLQYLQIKWVISTSTRGSPPTHLVTSILKYLISGNPYTA